jgi:hypothetical protein
MRQQDTCDLAERTPPVASVLLVGAALGRNHGVARAGQANQLTSQREQACLESAGPEVDTQYRLLHAPRSF